MESRFRRRAILSIVLGVMAAVSGCSDRPEGDGEAACCGTSAEPVFLASKLDDDDGDGNPFDEDFPSINDEDDDIADHAWIRDRRGVYHLFFQNEGHGTGSDIEHYTSTDLRTLEYVGVALQKIPGTWDGDALWAPHVVESGGLYYMFYTGVTGSGARAAQRIGLATSDNLTDWTRYPINDCAGTSGDGCVYECDECWTAWGAGPGSYNQQCRDPFVIRDAAARRWVLFATAKSPDESGVVTVASSTTLTDWSGAGYIDATRRLAHGTGGQPTGGQAENPCILTRAGTHYLFFSDWRDPEDPGTVPNPRTIVQYATSPSLAVDSLGSGNWTYRGYTPDPGVNAIEVQLVPGNTWIMSQSIANENSGDHDAHRRDLRLKCLVWLDGFEFGTTNSGGLASKQKACAAGPLAVPRTLQPSRR